MTAQTFDAYVINLDRDAARLDHMRRECAREGVAFERFPAVAPQGDAAPGGIAFDPGAGLSNGEIGCYASHLSILRLAAEGARPVLVMEDDIALAPGALARIETALLLAPADWGFLRLSNPPKRPCRIVAQADAAAADGTALVEYWRIPNGTGAYLASPAGARAFAAAYDERARAVDEDMRRDWEHGVPTYGVMPPPVAPAEFESAIDAAGGRSEAPGRRRFRGAGRGIGEPWWRNRLRRWGPAGAAAVFWRAMVLSAGRRLGRDRADWRAHVV